MRVLVDECAPRAVKKHLTKQGHDCSTVQECGWSGKRNGELLSVAEAAFDVLITVDTNLRYQQNLTGRKIAIVILLAPSNRLEHLQQHFSDLAITVERIKPGQIVQVGSSIRDR